MPANLHATSIPAEVLAEITQHLTASVALIKPYQIPRTPEERRDMLVLGQKSLGFVERTHELAGQNPQFLPAFLDIADFDIDVTDARGLWVISNLAQQLANAVNDTVLVAGSEAYKAALLYYSAVKVAAAQNVPGAKAIFDDLKSRFPRGRRRVPEGTTEPEAGE
jgi:hypothetical protein